MVRRTSSRRKTDDHAFPVRVRFCDRDPGPDWIRWNEAETWLIEKVGKGHFAKHGTGGRHDLYFRSPEAAHLFLTAFPHFTLYDMTEQVDYLLAAQTGNPAPLGGSSNVSKATGRKPPTKRLDTPSKPAPQVMAQLNLPDLRREVETIAGGNGAFQDVTQPRDFRAFAPAPADIRLKEAGPVRAPAERMSFGRWLVRQDSRGGLIGQLVECAKADRTFPLDGSPEAVREHLRLAMADGDMFMALDDAELDWEG